MTDPHPYLIIDGCFARFSIALASGDTIISSYIADTDNAHAEDLVTKISEILVDANVSFAKLYNIYVTVGPGSFTGIRSGLAAALGIATVNNGCMRGISVFEALRVMHSGADVVFAMEAGKGEYYLYHAEDAADVIKTSDKLPENAVLITRQSTGLESIVKLITQKHDDGEEFLPAEPLYIKKPDAKLPSGVATTPL
jgi:tRNA threonylcarbamoyl adenosine modification protein YeaZ